MTAEKYIRQANRMREDILYSEKAQFGMATVWGMLHWILGVPSAVLSATAGLKILENEPTTAAVCAGIAAVLTTLLTVLDPQKSAKERHQSGVQYNILRGDIRRFVELDLTEDAVPDDARQRIEEFANRKATLDQSAPHTGGLPYWLARSSIQKGQHEYEVDNNPK